MAAIIVTVIALASCALAVLWWARRPTEVVKLRNALHARPGRPEDFSWVPPAFPPGFAVEQRSPSADLQAVVSRLGARQVQDEFERALLLAGHLTERAADREPLRTDPVTTYHGIRGGAGYCADFVKAFLALAHAADLPARQWAFSFDGFGGHGHAVVEVYDRRRGKWIFVDVFNNFHAVDAATGEPLSVFEYRDALLGLRGSAAHRRNGPGRPGFVHEHKALEYYRRGIHQWYLVFGNAVESFYAHPAVRMALPFSRVLAHAAGNLFGLQPGIRIYVTSENATAVRHLLVMRRWLVLLAAAALALLLILAWQLAIADGSTAARSGR
jgi:hypothetical protein